MQKKNWIIVGIVLTVFAVGFGGFFIYKTLNRVEEIEEEPKVEDSFNLKLIKIAHKNRNSKNSNYLISPYSIEIALNMLREGASGQSLEEIDKVLPKREIADISVKNKVSVANALYMKDKYEPYIEESFKNTIKEKYNGDMILDPFLTPDKINNWTKEHTNGMIEKVLDEMDDNFVLGMENAIVIDTEWKEEFSCQKNSDAEFEKENGEKISGVMMQKSYTEDAKYFTTDHSKGAIIPYKKYNENGEEAEEGGKQLEFVGILPLQKDLDSFINNLTDEELKQIDDNTKELSENQELITFLPGLKDDYDFIKFKDSLIEMGIKSVFDKEIAELERIIPKTKLHYLGADTKNIYVQEAIHKTAIELTKKGTKAAAITYFGIAKSNSAMVEKEIISVNFNRPFAYMIRDVDSKEILFFGVIEEPNIVCEE